QKVTCLINAVSIGTLLFIGCEILLNEIKQHISRKVRLCKWLSFCFSCLISFALISFTTSMAPHTHGDIDTLVNIHDHNH
ncbi:Zn2+ or Fe2+ permease, partial [Plasmodium gaboni]